MSQKIRTLIITGQTDIHHNWQATTPAIKNILEESGRFAVEVTTSYNSEMAKTLQTDFDLIVLNYYGRHEPWGKIPEQLFESEAEQALYEFVESGKGFIGYHPSLNGGVGWDEKYHQLFGGLMRGHLSRRSPAADFIVRQGEPHPITAGMPAEIPHYQDDIYVDVDWNTATDVTVLLTGWDNPLRYTQVPSQWRALPHMGEDQPVVWVQNFGSGRSMTVGLGHGVVALSRPLLKAILLRGAEWAATGSVTIPFDAEIATPMEGGDWWPTILEPQVRAMFEKWVADGEPA